MKNNIDREQLLKSFAALENNFNASLKNAKKQEEEFNDLRSRFIQRISDHLVLAEKQIPKDNPVHAPIVEFTRTLDATRAEWDKNIAGQKRGVEFRKGFEDSLLVFANGKVKSGKSSLGNYLAWGHTDPTLEMKNQVFAPLKPRYKSHEKSAVQGGDTDQEAQERHEFRVGATEATSSIQSFTLPGLTWVDSPGLHSCNEENGKLATDFRDHADLILYTMKSDAVGRESDLAEIKNLFGKGKETMLLITGSDDVEEDFDDVTSTLIQEVVMKDLPRRAQQQDYVRTALKETLKAIFSAEEVQQIEIVSLSARYAQLHPDDLRAFQDSGMGYLCETLHRICQSDGVRLKQRTPITNLRAFLQNCQEGLIPFQALIEDFKQPFKQLRERSARPLKVRVGEGQKELEQLIHDFFVQMESQRDSADKVTHALEEFQQKFNTQFQEVADKQLSIIFEEIMVGFRTAVKDTYKKSQLMQLPGFELMKVTEEIPYEVHQGTRKRNSALGAMLGGVFGLLVAGPAGAGIGAALGGAAGSASGDGARTLNKSVDVITGDNLQDIRQQLILISRNALDAQMCESAATLWQSMDQHVDQLLNTLSSEISQFDAGLEKLLQQINHTLNKEL